MNCNNLPTILGTGITGLAMCHHLSKAKIKHVLIGEEPSDVQRFGESIDITGTIELRAEFLEQHNKFAGRKIAVDFWAWGNVVFMDNRIKKVLGDLARLSASFRVFRSLSTCGTLTESVLTGVCFNQWSKAPIVYTSRKEFPKSSTNQDMTWCNP